MKGEERSRIVEPRAKRKPLRRRHVLKHELNLNCLEQRNCRERRTSISKPTPSRSGSVPRIALGALSSALDKAQGARNELLPSDGKKSKNEVPPRGRNLDVGSKSIREIRRRRTDREGGSQDLSPSLLTLREVAEQDNEREGD
jgi:hypothetical protein